MLLCLTDMCLTKSTMICRHAQSVQRPLQTQVATPNNRQAEQQQAVSAAESFCVSKHAVRLWTGLLSQLKFELFGSVGKSLLPLQIAAGKFVSGTSSH